MKHAIIPSCLLVAIGLAWLVTGCSSTPTLAVQQAGYPREKVDAPGIFAENCAACHGRDGRARTFHGRLLGAQNFTDAHWQTDISSDEIVRVIQNGHKRMPAFQKKLSETEIEALANYLREFRPAS